MFPTATSDYIVHIIAPITQHLHIIVDHILEVRNQVEVEVKVAEAALNQVKVVQSLVEVVLSLVEVKVVVRVVEAALNQAVATPNQVKVEVKAVVASLVGSAPILVEIVV